MGKQEVLLGKQQKIDCAKNKLSINKPEE